MGSGSVKGGDVGGRIIRQIVWGLIGLGSFGLFIYECYLVLTDQLQMAFWEVAIGVLALFSMVAATTEMDKR